MGISTEQRLHRNLTPTQLYEHALRRGEGIVTNSRGGGGGPFAAVTSPHTGRSPNDKFLVQEPDSTERIWWGKVNQPIAPAKFERLKADVEAHLSGQELFVRDVYAGADPAFRLPIRFMTPNAWHALFVYNMFLRPADGELSRFAPGFEVLHAPEFHADPAIHGTKSGTFIIISFEQRTILIGGTRYAGELKKSIFSVLNYLMPLQGVLSMHCSANVGKQGDCALFFGLSGTGKTTLSADPERRLIGDDEHGWSERGVFNFEGGCYAKVIRLSPEAEPQIYACTRMFGTVLENVVIYETSRDLDLDSDAITENTRAAYPRSFIPNVVPSGIGNHPKNIIMLTCDAFGVMPPVARLSPEQAMYHFISGYTAKVAGTEKGLGKEPQATFSACFGAPFMVLHPSVYANLLREKISRHKVDCWLVNTGWSGGPYGVGSRMKIQFTRAIIHSILDGRLSAVSSKPDPVFGIYIPDACPGVPSEILTPRNTWKDGAAYDAKAKDLARRFARNFDEFSGAVRTEVKEAGPRVV